MLSKAERDALTQAEFQLRQQAMDQVERVCRGSWLTLGSWRDPDVERWLLTAVPTVRAGMYTVASAATIRLSRSIELSSVPPVIDLDGLRGLPLNEVYWRPAVRMRWMLGQGRSLDDALQVSANRVSSLVKTDLQLAYTHQCRAVLEAARA